MQQANVPTRDTRFFFLLAACFFAASTALHADVIELVTGDQLIGTIISQDDEAVVIAHPVLGTIQLPREQIATITLQTTERPKAQRVEDVAPEVVDEIREQARIEVLEEHQAQLDDAQAAIVPEDAVGDEVIPSRYQNLPPALRATMETLAEWNVQLELGISGSEGNKPTFGFRIAGSASHEDESNRTKFLASYYHLKTNRKTDKDEAHALAQNDFLIADSPWFYWARGSYDYNINQFWRNRVSIFGGAGYEFIDTDDLAIVGRAGAGATYNFEGDDNLQPELYFGVDVLRWKPFKGHLLTASAAWIPNVADFPQSRTEARLEYQISIPSLEGLAIKFGLTNEYQSQTEDGTKHNEFTYFSSLVYGF